MPDNTSDIGVLLVNLGTTAVLLAAYTLFP